MKENNENLKYNILTNENSKKIDYTFKVIIIGNAGVGKSSLSIKATKNIFEINYLTTIGVEFFDLIIELKQNNKVIKLQIWDTCGQEIYRSLISTYYKKASLAFIVYAINDKDSFFNIDNWIKDLKENSNPDIKIFLIGNKCDLEKERKINQSDGEKICNEYEMDFFFETSAKTGFNVNEIFVLAAKILLNEIYEINDSKNKKNKLKKKKLEGKSKLILGNSFLEKEKNECC